MLSECSEHKNFRILLYLDSYINTIVFLKITKELIENSNYLFSCEGSLEHISTTTLSKSGLAITTSIIKLGFIRTIS